jgi:hypothetical protein
MPDSKPVCWIVIRRRGGWNANPQVVGLYDTEGASLAAACSPETFGNFDPPPDDTDVFTCHRVMPSLIQYGPVRAVP